MNLQGNKQRRRADKRLAEDQNKTIEIGHFMTNVELFADLPTADSAQTNSADSATVGESDNQPTEPANTSDSDNSSSEDSPVETVAQVPAGAMSITEFAAYMTQTLMRRSFEQGGDLDSTDYVVPQAVYQTVKAQRDRIPHVIVKALEDTEGRVYILKDEATDWWLARKERLATRGTGAQRASSRSTEENLTLLTNAVAKALYARDRHQMWAERVEQSAGLVSKYQGFLKDADVSEETIALTIQEATDAYNAEKVAKENEKKSTKEKTPVAANA